MSKDLILNLLRDRPVAYRADFALMSGSVQAGVFLSQLFYWLGRQQDPSGWMYKTRDEWLQETGLTRYNQETGRKILRKMGILEEKLKGNPAQLHYRINEDKLIKCLTAYYKDSPESVKPSNKLGGNPPTSRGENSILSLTENTTENTTESFNGSADRKKPEPVKTSSKKSIPAKNTVNGEAKKPESMDLCLKIWLKGTGEEIKPTKKLTGVWFGTEKREGKDRLIDAFLGAVEYNKKSDKPVSFGGFFYKPEGIARYAAIGAKVRQQIGKRKQKNSVDYVKDEEKALI